MLATVLSPTSSVDREEAELGDRRWRDLRRAHHALVREQLARFRGGESDTAGDGFFATFDGPARAIRCAPGDSQAVATMGLEVRAGLHTGECELSARTSPASRSRSAPASPRGRPGEVLVSQTVKDLVAGSGLGFEDRGVPELKGVPGEWRLWAVESASL